MGLSSWGARPDTSGTETRLGKQTLGTEAGVGCLPKHRARRAHPGRRAEALPRCVPGRLLRISPVSSGMTHR